MRGQTVKAADTEPVVESVIEPVVESVIEPVVERCAPCEAARADHGEPAFARWVTRLVHDHRASLARVARGEGLLAEDAFDTVQEAFRAFLVRDDAAALVTQPEAARKLLVVLTRNLARNRRRLHASARPHVSDASIVDELPDTAPTTDQLMESIEQREQLARMLDAVPGEDVARMLGIAPGNVAVLLHRAKANLATCMAAAELSETDGKTDRQTQEEDTKGTTQS
jgi:RNA polymerase sigma-70 factor (ECF subfamily)